jgi:hypothetical protein
VQLLQFALKVVQIVGLVAFGGTYVFVPCHVLHLSQVHCFEPISYRALPYLLGVRNAWVYLLYILKQVQKTVFNILAAVDADKELFF